MATLLDMGPELPMDDRQDSLFGNPETCGEFQGAFLFPGVGQPNLFDFSLSEFCLGVVLSAILLWVILVVTEYALAPLLRNLWIHMSCIPPFPPTRSFWFGVPAIVPSSSFISPASPFAVTVLGIVCLSSVEQVSWVHTGRVVTVMAAHVGLLPEFEEVGNSMGQKRSQTTVFLSPSHGAIATVDRCTFPFPTGSRRPFLDLRPEALNLLSSQGRDVHVMSPSVPSTMES